MRLPISHDLRSDTTLQRQAETGSDFLFRKEMLPCAVPYPLASFFVFGSIADLCRVKWCRQNGGRVVIGLHQHTLLGRQVFAYVFCRGDDVCLPVVARNI